MLRGLFIATAPFFLVVLHVTSLRRARVLAALQKLVPDALRDVNWVILLDASEEGFTMCLQFEKKIGLA